MISKLTVLGSTGSIGTQTLDVIDGTDIGVYALAAHSNTALLEKQVRKYRPAKVCIFNEEKYADFKASLADTDTKVLTGMEGLCEIAADTETDLVLNSVVGMVGLKPTLAALEAGNKVALANKETLVAGGELVMPLAAKKGLPLLPVDSEHSAIFQCLQGSKRKELKKIFLTASGGPFFGKKREELENIRPCDALKHPNWDMGAKVTIDSSTLMNKGLESIEAKWLFDLEPSQIEVVVHRQSIVHSAVCFADNSVIAQLAVPDMRLPIQYAVLYPDRVEGKTAELSLFDYPALTFERPDRETFRCLDMAFLAMEKKQNYSVIMNAANEVAVESFLREEIAYLDIPDIIQAAFENVAKHDINTYADVTESDKAARAFVREMIAKGLR